jgi:hypothetical protein
LTIIDSPNYETLIVDELFNKLKSIEINNPTRAKIENSTSSTMALILCTDGSLVNLSPILFALSSLVCIIEEQVEALDDDELAWVISWFTWFHNNHMNHMCDS